LYEIMTWLNNIIMDAALAGRTQLVYYGFHVLGFLAAMLFNLWYAGRFGFKKSQGFLIVLFVYPVIYLWMMVQYWIESGFTSFGGQNIVRCFIYIPLACWPIARLLKLRWSKVIDFAAPTPCIVHGVSHLGCV